MSAFSASPLSSVDAEDLYRLGYPSGAIFSSAEPLDNNRIFHSYHRRAFARWRLSPVDKRLSSRGTPFAHCRAFRAILWLPPSRASRGIARNALRAMITACLRAFRLIARRAERILLD